MRGKLIYIREDEAADLLVAAGACKKLRAILQAIGGNLSRKAILEEVEASCLSLWETWREQA